MLLGALIVLAKIIGILMGIALIVILAAPFALSSRISREEEAEEYRILCQRLQKLTDLKAANDAEHHAPPKVVEL
jgi:hypothetical protein